MSLCWGMANFFFKEFYKIVLFSDKGIFLIFDLYFHCNVWNTGQYMLHSWRSCFSNVTVHHLTHICVRAKCSCFQYQYYFEVVLSPKCL